MSRLAAKPIILPVKVTADQVGDKVTVKGPLGSLSRDFRNEIDIKLTPEGIVLTPVGKQTPQLRALWGTYASHLKNMVAGVSKGFEKKLIVEGIGYKVNLSGTKLALSLGFSHPVEMPIPEGLKVVVDKNLITINGVDKELVGQFAARLRDLKKPEPYKGKGIRYEKEVVRRKEGKKVVA